MTITQRVLRFLTSRKNIGASLLALGAAALFVLGITGGWIGLAAVPIVYALGYFLIRPEQGLKLTFFDERDAQQIRQGLNDLTYSLRFRVADDVVGRGRGRVALDSAHHAGRGSDGFERDRSDGDAHPPDGAALPAPVARGISRAARASTPSAFPSRTARPQRTS